MPRGVVVPCGDVERERRAKRGGTKVVDHIRASVLGEDRLVKTIKSRAHCQRVQYSRSD
jgi:hypothetical protein